MRIVVALTAAVAAAALFGADRSPALAQPGERPVLSLSGANFRPLPLAIAPMVYSSDTASRTAGQELDATLAQDLGVSGIFELLDRKSFLAEPNEGTTAATIKFKRWLDVGAEGLIKVAVSDLDPVTAEFSLFNAVTAKLEIKKKYSAPAARVRELAHRFADDVFTFYTNEPGAFRTRMAFVRRNSDGKQVYVSDWDGFNAYPVTRGSLNLLPAWAPDGDTVAFTSYRSGNPDLFSIDLRSNKVDPLFHRTSSLVTGACFSRDGRRIAFSMSEDDGNSHIWLADRDGKNARKLTEGFGINSSPTFSPDGKQIAFVSNRAGSPQIYVMSIDGGAPRRLTFQGNYNQTPDWSARGDLIAFTARDERNVFDIFTVDPATTKITRLTQDQGNNEEPTFSPNGRLVAFTSTRTGKSQLWVMSADGNAQRQVTNGADEVFTPSWGPLVKDR